jgi:hypothetical protein
MADSEDKDKDKENKNPKTGQTSTRSSAGNDFGALRESTAGMQNTAANDKDQNGGARRRKKTNKIKHNRSKSNKKANRKTKRKPYKKSNRKTSRRINRERWGGSAVRYGWRDWPAALTRKLGLKKKKKKGRTRSRREAVPINEITPKPKEMITRAGLRRGSLGESADAEWRKKQDKERDLQRQRSDKQIAEEHKKRQNREDHKGRRRRQSLDLNLSKDEQAEEEQQAEERRRQNEMVDEVAAKNEEQRTRGRTKLQKAVNMVTNLSPSAIRLRNNAEDKTIQGRKDEADKRRKATKEEIIASTKKNQKKKKKNKKKKNKSRAQSKEEKMRSATLQGREPEPERRGSGLLSDLELEPEPEPERRGSGLLSDLEPGPEPKSRPKDRLGKKMGP